METGLDNAAPRKSHLPLNDRDEPRPLSFLMPYPQRLRLGHGQADLVSRRVACQADGPAVRAAADLIDGLWTTARVRATAPADAAAYVVRLSVADQDLPPEGYALEIGAEGARLAGQDAAGLWYGVQTLLQLAAFGQGTLPVVRIRDWPALGIRAVMLDLGRSLYPKPLILRAIRIMSRLKLNTLHMHLYDDQLMGVRFRRLPLGRENPGALTIADLAEIVRYARQYHIAVCPELESWGHVASVLYHFPECYGTVGRWGGQSFGIGPRTFNLLGRLYDEIVPVLEPASMVHLGLDEAHWALLPGVRARAGMNPEWLVGHLHDLLMKVGRRHGKRLTMRVWADHGGRPVPARLCDRVIVEPWNYYESGIRDIRRKVRRFAGADKGPFLMGAGSSNMHFNGSVGSTRLWCLAGHRAPNCRGVTICLWEGNQLDRYLLSLYGGAACAWNPQQADAPDAADLHREYVTGRLTWRMLSWQTLFPDAGMDALLRDRGPAVYRGYYLSGARAGQPVAPTVLAADRPPREAATGTRR